MNLESTIPSKYLPLLSRTFYPIVMNNLINNGRSPYLKEVLIQCGMAQDLTFNMSFKQFFEKIYDIISSSYRNEYIYKNAIANNILLGRHSLNTSVMLSEFRVGNCKADVVILNGTSTVYEIKSEYDSFDRIENQIRSYMSVFDRVNVITSKSQIPKITNILPDEIGLLELTQKSTIRILREAKSNKKQVKPEVIFDSLRKTEYLDIIKKYFSRVPEVLNTQIYTECLNLFKTLPPETAHNEMVRVLYNRQNKQELKKLIKNTPTCLKAYAIGSNLTNKQVDNFYNLLEKRLVNILLPDNNWR